MTFSYNITGSINVDVQCQLLHSDADEAAKYSSNSHAGYEQTSWNLAVNSQHV